MELVIWIVAAVCCYAVGSVNPAIVMSKAIYHQDIREQGSGNPGFTNFKRVYGDRYAWYVLALDLFKGAVMSLLFGALFKAVGLDRQLGAAWACLFTMLGHSFPPQYGFRGGKGFLVCLSSAWVIHPIAGLVATALMVVLVLTVKYMSLATMCGLAAGAVCLFLLRADLFACLIYTACVLFMIARHHENIGRLIAGTESKFSLGGRKKR